MHRANDPPPIVILPLGSFSIGYTLFGTALMHFLPVGLVIYMYKPAQ